jgi:hypothetical protein
MAGTQHGHIVRILLHPHECDLSRYMDAGFSWTCTFNLSLGTGGRMLICGNSGPIVVILQLCLWSVDVLDYGQRGWETSAKDRHIQWSRGVVRPRH